MARPKSLNPAYCLHKPSGRAYVRIDGQRKYLGAHGSQASRDEYSRAIGEWIACGRQSLPKPVAGNEGESATLTIAELVDAFWRHAQTYYLDPDGNPTPILNIFRQALRPVVRLYGKTAALDFGPMALKAVRQAMLDLKPAENPDGIPHRIKTGDTRCRWSRQYVNRQISRVRHLFRWAAENELLPVTIAQALATVPALKKGKTTAPERKKVKPVDPAHVAAVLPFLSPQVKAMVQLQQLSGARGGELCILRTGDIDRSNARVWQYRPTRHKTEVHDHDRVIRFGPQAQEILTPFLKLDPNAYVFSPAAAEAERRAKASENRKTPISCGNKPGTHVKRKPTRQPGERYTKDSYAQAITQACRRAFPPPEELSRGRVPVSGRKNQTRMETLAEWRARLGTKWVMVEQWRKDHHFHPHQIRHGTATKLRSQFGIDVAQTILGHAIGSSITEVYAEADHEKANEAVAKTG